jgi:septum formation protein
MNFELPKLVLASGSPRRAEILTAVGWDFKVSAADIDETPLLSESPEEYVKRLAVAKADEVASRTDEGLILGADTTVVIDEMIIGKPTGLGDARRMLRSLSGRWHEVLTGVAVITVGKSRTNNPVSQKNILAGLERTRVKFVAMTEAEIDFLVENGSPLDKAGAYAVQAQAALFIELIEGDYWNVVGLPVGLLYRLVSSLRKNWNRERSDNSPTGSSVD